MEINPKIRQRLKIRAIYTIIAAVCIFFGGLNFCVDINNFGGLAFFAFAAFFLVSDGITFLQSAK
jgi:hypothetical protein